MNANIPFSSDFSFHTKIEKKETYKNNFYLELLNDFQKHYSSYLLLFLLPTLSFYFFLLFSRLVDSRIQKVTEICGR